MKRFRFRLERVLGLKKRAEKAARLELGRALSAVNAAQARLRESERACALLEEEEVRLSAEGRIGALPLQGALLSYARAFLERAREEAAAAERELEAARQGWREAKKEARSLELLRERAYRAWQEKTWKEEDRELDEIGRLRFLAGRFEEP